MRTDLRTQNVQFRTSSSVELQVNERFVPRIRERGASAPRHPWPSLENGSEDLPATLSEFIGMLLMFVFAKLVADTAEGGLVFGLAIGGSTAVIGVAVVCGGILLVAGLVALADLCKSALTNIMSGRIAFNRERTAAFVAALKRQVFTAGLGHVFEIAFEIGEINSE